MQETGSWSAADTRYKKAREMGYYVIATDDEPNAPGMALADKATVMFR